MLRLAVKILQVFSYVQICDMHNMGRIEKEAVGFPVVCHLVERGFT